MTLAEPSSSEERSSGEGERDEAGTSVGGLTGLGRFLVCLDVKFLKDLVERPYSEVANKRSVAIGPALFARLAYS